MSEEEITNKKLGSSRAGLAIPLEYNNLTLYSPDMKGIIKPEGLGGLRRYCLIQEDD